VLKDAIAWRRVYQPGHAKQNVDYKKEEERLPPKLKKEYYHTHYFVLDWD
jgi:hypothetical protein